MIIYQKEIGHSLLFKHYDDGSVDVIQQHADHQDIVHLSEDETISLYQFLAIKFGAV